MKSTRVGLLRHQDEMSGDVAQSPKKRTCIQWDEDNLALNEAIKADLDCQKIDEPDTPFVRSPVRDDDGSDDEDNRESSQLAISEEAKAKIEALASAQTEAVTASDQAESSKEEKPTGAKFASLPPVPPSGRSSGARFAVPEPRASLTSDDGARRMSDADTAGSRDGDSIPRGSNTGWTTEEEDEELKARQLSNIRRRMSNGEPCDLPDLSPSDLPHLMRQTSFDEKRKQHYNLRDALRRGKELLEAEEDEDEEDEELNHR